MEIKHVSRFLIVSLVVNSLLMVSAIMTLTILRLRVREYKPRFPVTDDQILDRVGSTTFQFLTNYIARAESNQTTNAKSTMPKVLTLDFKVYGALRGDRMIYFNTEYTTGDFIEIDNKVYLIFRLDFDRQRVYLQDEDGSVVICVAGAPVRAPRGRTRRTHDDASAKSEEDGTI